MPFNLLVFGVNLCFSSVFAKGFAKETNGWISLRSHSPEGWFFVLYASDKSNNTKKDFISLHVTGCSNVPSDLSETCDSYQHLWKSKGPIPRNAFFSPRNKGFSKGSLNHHHTLIRPYWGLISLVVTWHWRVYTLSFPFKDWAFVPCIHPDLQLLSFFSGSGPLWSLPGFVKNQGYLRDTVDGQKSCTSWAW